MPNRWIDNSITFPIGIKTAIIHTDYESAVVGESYKVHYCDSDGWKWGSVLAISLTINGSKDKRKGLIFKGEV